MRGVCVLVGTVVLLALGVSGGEYARRASEYVHHPTTFRHGLKGRGLPAHVPRRQMASHFRFAHQRAAPHIALHSGSPQPRGGDYSRASWDSPHGMFTPQARAFRAPSSFAETGAEIHMHQDLGLGESSGPQSGGGSGSSPSMGTPVPFPNSVSDWDWGFKNVHKTPWKEDVRDMVALERDSIGPWLGVGITGDLPLPSTQGPPEPRDLGIGVLPGVTGGLSRLPKVNAVIPRGSSSSSSSSSSSQSSGSLLQTEEALQAERDAQDPMLSNYKPSFPDPIAYQHIRIPSHLRARPASSDPLAHMQQMQQPPPFEPPPAR